MRIKIYPGINEVEKVATYKQQSLPAVMAKGEGKAEEPRRPLLPNSMLPVPKSPKAGNGSLPLRNMRGR